MTPKEQIKTSECGILYSSGGPIGKLKGIRYMLSALQDVCFSNIDITIRVKATGLKSLRILLDLGKEATKVYFRGCRGKDL